MLGACVHVTLIDTGHMMMRGHIADMASIRLNETFVKSLQSPEKGNRIAYDAELKGFGIRVTAKGAKAFVLNYRAHGSEKRFTIGGYPEWSAMAARRHAETLKRQIDLGQDPMVERIEDRSALSMKQLCERYAGGHLPKKRPSSQRNDRSMIDRHIVPNLGNIKASSIRHSDVANLHRSISKNTPALANRVISLLSKIFSLSIKWDVRTDNPAIGVDRNDENQRSRYLSGEELVRLASSLDRHGDQLVANVFRLLLLTGARRTELLSATWDMFDLDKAVWVKPHTNTKQRREHRVPLSATAVDYLAKMKAADTSARPHLFPSRSRSGHLTEVKKAWATICARAQIKGVRIHDLRHTYASYVVSSGQTLSVVGALLGHTQSQTTQRYAHLQDDPLRAATELAALGMTMKLPSLIPVRDAPER